MCTKEEVEILLQKNNKERDQRFDLRLMQNNEKIFERIEKEIFKIRPSGHTDKEISEIKTQCVVRGTELAVNNLKQEQMNKKLDLLADSVKELSNIITSMLKDQAKRREEDAKAREIKESEEIKAREIKEREMDNKYAPMAAWSALKFVGGVIAVAIIGAIMGLILIK